MEIHDAECHQNRENHFVRIGILGPLEVLAEGRPREVGGARLRELLTRLALEPGRTIPAERLIDHRAQACVIARQPLEV